MTLVVHQGGHKGTPYVESAIKAAGLPLTSVRCPGSLRAQTQSISTLSQPAEVRPESRSEGRVEGNARFPGGESAPLPA